MLEFVFELILIRMLLINQSLISDKHNKAARPTIILLLIYSKAVLMIFKEIGVIDNRNLIILISAITSIEF